MRSTEGYLATGDGVRLYFETLGGGSPCVVVPNGINLRADFGPLAERYTLVLYDPRHRGQSDPLAEPAQATRGVWNDIDDLEAIRRHFGLDSLSLIGHSYMGLTAALYAREYPARVTRVVQIGAMGAFPDKEYPARLTGTDSVAVEVFARLNELRKERDAYAPEEFCRKFWSVLRLLYVVDPADAPRADWGRCELPNERNFMRYWTEALLPSIQALRLAPEDWARIETPVLTIHGTKDRSVPYGAGRDWALTLPNARLLTVADAGHLPWIEAPDTVLDAIRTFLDGAWPDAAVKVDRLDPEPTP